MQSLLEYLRDGEREMIRFLGTLVNIDSGTYHKAGVDQVGAILADKLEGLGFEVSRDSQEHFGHHVLGHKPGSGANRLLLLGHMDTVFPPGTAQQRPFRIEGTRAYGPGVLDMKGGITCLLFALEALKNSLPESWEELVLDAVFNSDEELLSRTSRPLIEGRARKAHAVCVYEPARPGGEVVIQRKTVGKYVMEVFGRAAHAGAQPEEGRSAIAELAHKTVALHALSDLESGTTVNVGVVRAGERSNIIADRAYAEIDVRAVDQEEAERLDAAMRSIAGNYTVPDTRCELSGGFEFPPMLPTSASRRLFEAFREAGAVLGLDLTAIATGGGSDGNHASRFAPTLDGLGPAGAGAHSEREFIELPSLVERAQLTALFLATWPDVAAKLNAM